MFNPGSVDRAEAEARAGPFQERRRTFRRATEPSDRAEIHLGKFPIDQVIEPSRDVRFGAPSWRDLRRFSAGPRVLSSDEFEGRAPGSKGEELSVKYITDQFKKIGLKPGNPDGTYTQEVPLAGIKSEPRMSFVIGDKTMDLKNQDDFVASSARLQPEIKIEKSDLVFV